MYKGEKVIVVLPAYNAALTLEKTYKDKLKEKSRLLEAAKDRRAWSTSQKMVTVARRLERDAEKIEEGEKGSLTFLANPKYLDYIFETTVYIDPEFDAIVGNWSTPVSILDPIDLTPINTTITEKLYSYLDNDIGMQNNQLFIHAMIFVNKYKSNIENYGKIVSKHNEYITNNNTVTDDDNYLISNFTSFVNYNGSETYLTNGAFIDVVINQQLCSTGDKIKISKPYMYFTSFIENISDLLTHYHKSKYTERCENSLNELNKLLRDQGLSEWGSVYSDTLDLLKWLRITQKKCDDDVYKCQVFDLMYTCIYIVVKISDVYYKYVTKTYSSLDEGVEMFDKIKFPEIDEDSCELSPIKT